MSSLGLFSLMAGKIFSIKYDLISSIFTEVIGFVYTIPVDLLTLVLLAGS